MKDEKLILRAKFDEDLQKWIIAKKSENSREWAHFGSIQNTTFDYWKDTEKHIDNLIELYPGLYQKE